MSQPAHNQSSTGSASVPRTDDLRHRVALALINEQRTFHGLEEIDWNFPALSTPNKERALRQADAALSALSQVQP